MQDQPFLFVEPSRTVEELSKQESASNTQNATASSATSTQVKASADSSIPVGGHERSELMVSIFKKSQNRNERANCTEGIIRLLLIILWSEVVVVLGFLLGFTVSPPLVLPSSETKH